MLSPSRVYAVGCGILMMIQIIHVWIDLELVDQDLHAALQPSTRSRHFSQWIAV